MARLRSRKHIVALKPYRWKSLAARKEATLRRKRDELERSLRNLADLVDRAEAMVKQVGAAMQILAGNLEDA